MRVQPMYYPFRSLRNNVWKCPLMNCSSLEVWIWILSKVKKIIFPFWYHAVLICNFISVCIYITCLMTILRGFKLVFIVVDLSEIIFLDKTTCSDLFFPQKWLMGIFMAVQGFKKDLCLSVQKRLKGLINIWSWRIYNSRPI